ncbi:endonuclease-3 [Xanthobacter agilis]|uniref:Endonuclease III n=1 Tax=Xanthobacter agilis TaxID=47492 RepID=A0ABU0LD78_XANAG|nr:endonuclease III [Xanthobacter agilis]MDQ0505052.1 endonuclease-3 [Xanthobacter agilis]
MPRKPQAPRPPRAAAPKGLDVEPRDVGSRDVGPLEPEVFDPQAIDPLADLISPPRGAKSAAKAKSTIKSKSATKAKSAAQPPVKGGAKGAARPVPAAPVPPPRRNKAVANAAAAVHGKTVAAWSDEEIVEAFSRFEAQNPEPKGELDHTDPYTLLVAVVLSAQATDVGVNKATKGLFAAASTPAAMVALGEEQVAHYIRTLGLYKNKAKNVVELSRLLLERHHGEVPRDREALEALPGVGRKTANVVLNIAFGVPTIAVDTHLFRVANRTGLAPGATPLAVEEGLEARIPDRFKLHAHHWLILHGRYICKARAPECGRCLIADLCRWPEKNF